MRQAANALNNAFLLTAVSVLSWGCRSGAVSAASDASRSDARAGAKFQDGHGATVESRPVSRFIVIDQFGYRPSSEKVAVIRCPKIGFDAGESFAPGSIYTLVDAHSGKTQLSAAPVAWNHGATDTSSGDAAWWFDFSSITTAGDYFVQDDQRNVRSPVFRIAERVYDGVLRQAMRMFYYQRDGTAKPAAFAGDDWADRVAHSQDAQCVRYDDGSSPKDLHGGWFDAGDQNRYTSLAANYAIELLRSYVETPSAFTDDYGIPESGNGLPDILDEVKWDLDWLTRMQSDDGSVLTIASHAGASPPSADKSPCKYGPASTSATLTAAAAFAYASHVFASAAAAGGVYADYASTLATRARRAWEWASANPDVTFKNTQHALGGGEQEVDDSGRAQKAAQAAVFLFELTGDVKYRLYFDQNYRRLEMAFDPFHMEQIDALLEYSKISAATQGVVEQITHYFQSNVEGPAYFGAAASNPDPYLAYLEHYTWGSNQIKAGQGNMFEDVAVFGTKPLASATAARYAERYIHYLHGVNPLQLVYLSNMREYGAETSVTRFFHTWFSHGSSWDATGTSKYGPPPGFLVGGPNPTYAWDQCCPWRCGATGSASCGISPPSPPAGQPPQKSYRDFNEGWPLNSWSITEPDDGYQAHYVRLLSKFVR